MDDALTEIGMSQRDARITMITGPLVSMAMLAIFLIGRFWTFVPVWMLAFGALIIAVTLWQSFRSPFERTVVYPDRLETRRRGGVVAVLPREDIGSFRSKSGGEGQPSVQAIGVDGKKTKLLGTDHASSSVGWINRFRGQRRQVPDLLPRFEDWKQHGRWEL